MRLSRPIMLTSILAICLVGVFSFSKAQEARFKAAVLEQVDLGHVPAGDRVMKLTLLELQPGAEIPPHTHKGPGLRYVLDGAISIAWKDRGTEVFKAGSTYFEGAGENHPPGQMSAKNAAEGVTRVVIVELLPKE
jgi:quercetin dioxygenase-like cupin family protein